MDSTKTENDIDSPGPPVTNTNTQDSCDHKSEYTLPKNGKFRFKSESKSKRDDHGHHHRRSHRHHRRHRYRHDEEHNHSSSKRRKTRDSRTPSPFQNPHLSGDTAFRESLFDALGDDEGAAYWESVYGQPIHTYAIPSVPKGPNGELEQMSDEEYAAYVRARMWERTHEGIMEERERLRAEKAKQKERQEREGRERMQFERAIEESLRRGRERRRAKAWRALWTEYQRSWEELNRLAASGKEDDQKDGNNKDRKHLRNVIFWPVESGKRKDISAKAVEEFMRHAPPPEGRDEKSADPSDLSNTLKSERVRWHPDKIQHRYGSLGIDDVVMRSVTEVFQIIDQMWNEEREKRD